MNDMDSKELKPDSKKIESEEVGAGNTALEKIMKERFGAPDFGSIMNTIMEEMFKSVDKNKGGK